MRDVGQQRADGDHHLDPKAGGNLDDLGREGPPAQVGLVPTDHDQVVVGGREVGGAQLDRRPLDPPVPVDQPHRRAGRLEVVELLGVDGGEGLGGQPVRDRVQGGGGRLTGVVPAIEGGQQHRPTEPGPPDQGRVVHGSTMPWKARAAQTGLRSTRYDGQGSRVRRWGDLARNSGVVP